MTKLNENLKQHFVPVCYLKRFVGDDKKGRLNVVDFYDQASFLARPKKVAAQRLHNRLNDQYGEFKHDDIDKFLDDQFSNFNDQLDEIISSEAMPANEKDFSEFCFQASLLMARNLNVREGMERIMEIAANLHVKEMNLIDSAPEELKEYYKVHKDKTFQLKMNKDFHILSIIQVAVESFFKPLASRSWMVLKAPPTANFVTTDSPISVSFIDQKEGNGVPVGLNDQGTRVLFPISSNICLVGEFGEGLPHSYQADLRELAVMNTTILFEHRRQVFSANDDFLWFFEGKIRKRSDLLKLMKSKKYSDVFCDYKKVRDDLIYTRAKNAFLRRYDPKTLQKR